jgi:drug/metabolite transporter (DMT)-like permease
MQGIYPFVFVFLWSTGFIGAKYGLPWSDPLSFLFVRYLCVISLMLLVVFVSRAPWPREPRQWVHIGVTGLLVHGVYLSGVFMSIKAGLPAGISALVVGMQPLLTAVSAGWLLHEKIRPRQWAGLGLGFIGVALVVSGKFGEGTAALGPMLVPAFAALLGITAGTLYQKRFCAGFDLRTGSVIQFVPTALATGLAIPLFGEYQVTWSAHFVFALAWLVLVLSIGAISLLNLLIHSGSAVNVASLFYLTPPSTALLAWLMFGETLSPAAMVGMVVAITGVWMVTRGK